ncbi:hypothetical protein AWB68_08065 [Caballeronia choica]|uniref:Uncharacterized protein n=1 Tax=Caballeronia choica TaxID=326476 RepID=A0A158KZK6_9BURK|nr:hypothetical protein AWB68_08065 [Caballeronia choica]
MAPSSLRLECLWRLQTTSLCKRVQIVLRCGPNEPALKCLRKILLPSRGLPTDILVDSVDHHRLSVRVEHVLALGIDVDESLSCAPLRDLFGTSYAIQTAPFFGLGSHFATQLMTEVDRALEEGTKVVDRSLCGFEVVPSRLDHIRQTLAILTRFAHQFENQKINETQGPQALEILRYFARLSLLKSGRG